MRKVTRYTSITATAVVATLALGGCAAGAGDDDGRTRLVVWDSQLLTKVGTDGKANLDESFLHRAAEMYMDENPDISIEVVMEAGSQTDKAAQFQAASIAGNGPDVRVQNNGGPLLAFKDFYVNLEDQLDPAIFDDLSGWESVREGFEPDGAVLGLPYGAGSYFVVWYNGALLRDAGIDPADTPDSWEEMIAIGSQYKESAGQPAFHITNLEGYAGAWTFPALAGGELGGAAFTDQFAGTTKINSPEMVHAYEKWSELFASGVTNPDAGELSETELATGFVSGKAPYTIGGTWFNETMIEAFGEDAGYFFVPTPEGSTYEKVAAGGPNIAIGVTNYGKNQPEAIKFVEFLAQPEIQDLYVELTQIEGSNSKSADPSVITNPLLRQQAEELLSIDQIVFPLDSVMPQPVIDLYYRLNNTTFLGNQAAADAVQQLQTAFDQEQ